MRVILEATNYAEASECLRCATHLLESDHRDCLYQTPQGLTIYVKRTKTGVSARALEARGQALRENEQ